MFSQHNVLKDATGKGPVSSFYTRLGKWDALPQEEEEMSLKSGPASPGMGRAYPCGDAPPSCPQNRRFSGKNSFFPCSPFGSAQWDPFPMPNPAP